MKRTPSFFTSPASRRTVVLDCSSGISGDMTVAAFLDAGMNGAELTRQLRTLPLKGWRLSSKRVRRGAFCGTLFSVTVAHACVRHQQVSIRDIVRLLDRSALAPAVKERARTMFRHLAEAEARVHGIAPRSVHFHEVGAIDSIIDIVSAALCFTTARVSTAYALNVTVGSGSMHTAHGMQPVPAPAAMELLKGFPVTIADVPHELITPTGAVILKTFVTPRAPVPPFVVERIGYGAGTAIIPDRPNVVRILIGEAETAGGHAPQEDTLLMLETNIDDLPPFVYEHLMARLFRAGARDVFMTPIVMKKSRPAHMLSVLIDPQHQHTILDILYRETTTIGVRMTSVRRQALARDIKTVSTPYGTIDVKVARLPDGTHTAAPEYESCRRAALRHNVPLREVYQRAQREHNQQQTTMYKQHITSKRQITK